MRDTRGGIPREETNICVHDNVKHGLNLSPIQRAIYTKIVFEHGSDTSLGDMLGMLAKEYPEQSMFFAEPEVDERFLSCTVDEKLGRTLVTNIVSTLLPDETFHTAAYTIAVRGNEVLASLGEA